MDKKSIQEARKRKYFIDAAMEIIKKEGVDNLSVKKVADLAGYAPGTLYNYFTDLNALLGYCAAEFWIESREYVLEKVQDIEDIKYRFIRACVAYLEYFFDNPNVFKLIFLQDFIHDFKGLPAEIQDRVINPTVVALLREYFKDCVSEGIIAENKLLQLEDIIANYIHGILLFYIMERTNESRERIQKKVEKQIDCLLS